MKKNISFFVMALFVIGSSYAAATHFICVDERYHFKPSREYVIQVPNNQHAETYCTKKLHEAGIKKTFRVYRHMSQPDRNGNNYELETPARGFLKAIKY